MSGVNEIRSTFLDYFREERPRGRRLQPARAAQRPDADVHQCRHGAVQERLHRPGEAALSSAPTTSQKCVRAGGKHNDLDNVGYTARHHTFFEMLGNFSFGDYFKERAIELAWKLITKEFGLAKDKLLVTVYHTDDEAAALWKKIAGLPDDRIIRIPTSDNFWAMGDTGPCGPCSEIFYRPRRAYLGRPARQPGRGRRPLHRDSGTSSSCSTSRSRKDERVDAAAPLDRHRHGAGAHRRRCCRASTTTTTPTCSARLIDAIVGGDRACRRGRERREPTASSPIICAPPASSIADGVLPSNEGRGYVLRRIMRRAMRHAQLLGAREPLMWQLVPALVREMGQAYPELVRGQALITETLKLEETRFRKTLARGLGLLDEATAALASRRHARGETAFKLYDTYGFPLDLTQDALRQRGISVDLDGVQRRDGAAEGRGARQLGRLRRGGDRTVWFARAREARRDRVPRLRRPRRPRASSRRWCATAPSIDTARAGETGRRRRQPDAVLRRIRRPDGRYRRRSRARASASRSRTRRRGATASSCISAA